MAKEKYTKKELQDLIQEMAQEIMSQGDPTEVEMNQMVSDKDKIGTNSSQAYTKVDTTGSFEEKKADKATSTKSPTEVNMNQMDKEQGHNGDKYGFVVAFDEKNKQHSEDDHRKGMKEKKFKTKKGMQSKESSKPFDQIRQTLDSLKMNQMDREDDEGTKAYFEPGKTIKGKGYNTGQKEPKFYEEPKNEKETQDKIAQAITIPESFNNSKELKDFIINEAEKVSKNIL